ncbi:ElaB/YqjD/DUF883 family membrane-anchored ribosome-binding protein [Palleronia aestuarii]|uniref:ElaB/YqjD/DUF883 family membrane-anchored ribosome-binding protein n=1 Tax=Palleronia aestuarii TaxID=568105 RepID=A0A2W7NEP0_9RHOB|nr:DUF883 family protein [Palleronia aestuarii]PZX18895.1 ElaB/YqjD/DUF883 family membrane-anchored ribosome-binding protein [Palleronia aestuarii]
MAQSAKPDATVMKTDPTTEDLSRQVELLKTDISRLTETIGDLGRAKGRQLRSQAEDQAAYVRDRAEGKVDEIEQYVRANPATALGIAAGIGLLVGLLNRR